MNVALSKSSSIPRITVVGGGITGLAAAHRIIELLPHAALTLLEASPRLGGVLESVHRDGFLIERSADNFLTKQPHAVDLCRRLGIAGELVPTDAARRRAFVVRNGRLLPVPEGFYLMSPRKLGPILESPILSPAGKLRLLLEPVIPRAHHRLPAALQAHDFASDESVASFARRRLGRETFERLVQPLVAGMYTADPEKLSMAAAMPEFLALERVCGRLTAASTFSPSPARADEDAESPRDADSELSASGARYSLFTTPRNGIATLTNALADRLPEASIHLNTQVASIHFAPESGWRLETTTSGPLPSALREPLAADAVILALPSHAAARLLGAFDSALAAELAAIEYAGCAVISFGFARHDVAHALDGFGLVVPQIERRRIIAASFASQKFSGRAPKGAVLIRVFIGGALQPELLHLPDPQLRQLAIDELRGLLQIRGEPTVTDIARWPRSMPQYHVGHLERVARIEELAAPHATLALAGNAYRGVGIPQCIASAEAAASRIAARFLR